MNRKKSENPQSSKTARTDPTQRLRENEFTIDVEERNHF